MPHIELSYSANLENTTDIAGLCNALRLSCIETNVAPLAGIRIRAFKADHVSIADGDKQHGYIDFSVRLREGRSDEQKKLLTNTLFDTAKHWLAEPMNSYSIALSMELRDINDTYSPKTGSIRKHLNQSDTGA